MQSGTKTGSNSCSLARDRIGKKPLYYFYDRDRLIFASEIKAILEAPAVSRQIDLTALSDYLSILYVPAPKTIFESVRKLPAAHFAIARRDSFEVRSYWDLAFDTCHNADQARIEDELLGILDEATRLRMISEVPIGAFLSGGVDSSAVVALMAGHSVGPVITNSIAFSISGYDESAHAQRVAKQFSTDHHEFRVTPDAVAVVEKLAWHYDEPFADSSAIPTYYVSKLARHNVTVALSGDGGDENFAGYFMYYFDLAGNRIRNFLPPGLIEAMSGILGKLRARANYLPRAFPGKGFLSNLARDPVEAHFFSVSAFSEDEKRKLLHPDILSKLGDYRTSDLFHQIYKAAPASDHLSRIQYLDIKTYLCDDILTKVDRASMAVSLEVRCPLLDHVFMEYAARIPSTMKLAGKDGKHIFKKALKRYLPDDILYRKKMGFAVPLGRWLKKDLSDYAREIIFNGEAAGNYLQPNRLRELWDEHQTGLGDRSAVLWSVLMLNLWHRLFGNG